MKNRIKLFLIFSGLIFLFNGCTGSVSQVSPKPVGIKKEEIKINIKEDMDKFEKQLIEISKKAEYKYNQYIELLKNMKRKKVLEDNRIPRNLGKRFTFCFDGYALLLIKKVLTESGYSFDIGNLLIQDSPIIHRCYKNTMAIDILRDVSTGYGYDLIINERNMEARVRYTE
jgi:hypothetical protein